VEFEYGECHPSGCQSIHISFLAAVLQTETLAIQTYSLEQVKLFGTSALVIVSQLADLASSVWGLAHGAVERNALYSGPLSLILMKYVAVGVSLSALIASYRLSPRAFQIVAVTMVFFAGATFMQAWRNVSA
jgi:hypothetical protein